MRVIALGAGRQSTTVLMLANQGELPGGLARGPKSLWVWRYQARDRATSGVHPSSAGEVRS